MRTYERTHPCRAEAEKLKPREERLMLHPLKPQEALRAFMQVDPERVAARDRSERSRKLLTVEDLEDQEDLADALEAMDDPDAATWTDIKARYGL